MSLTDVDPCALLDTDRAIGLGYAAYERGPLGTSSCLYLPEGANAGDGGMSLSITFGDGLSALTPSPLDKATAAQVGDYSAVRIEASDAPRCTLVIGVSATETVNVGATSATTGQACEQADHIVDLIEPRLPAASS